MEISVRGAYRSQLTKIVKAASELLNSEDSHVDGKSVSDLESLEDQIVTLTERLSAVVDKLKTADQQIQSKELIKTENLEKDFEKIAEYEDAAVSAMSSLKNRLKRVRIKLNPSEETPEQTSIVTQKSSVKLPKLELKKFGGELQDWLPFWDQFETAVHRNETLAVVDKFQYLANCLYGPAKRTISGFTASASCYDAAISLLLEQYGNTDKLVDNYVQKLINIRPVISKTDCFGLRMLYNTVTTCIRSLTALHTPPDQYQVMLKSILLRCLPADLRVDYHRTAREKTQEVDEISVDQKVREISHSSLHDVYDPDVQDIIKFLKREVDALEKSRTHLQNNASKRVAPSPTTAASLLGVNNKEVCVFCRQSDHTAKDCKSGMTMKEKRDILLKSNRCFRCAKIGHCSRKCKSGKFLKCDHCSGRHITSMCDPSYNVTQKSSENAVSKSGCNLCTHTDNKQNVFLKTARCVVTNRNVNCLIRLIIDGGSQHTFIRQNVVRKLQLPVGKEKVRISVLPFGSKERIPSQEYSTVNILLKSQYGDKCVLVKAIIVPEICVDVLPPPDSSYRLFKKFKLADKICANIQTVDGLSLLIGSDHYWDVVTGKQRSVSNRLKAVETIFGWTLQGYQGTDNKILTSDIEHTPVVSSIMSLTNLSDAELSKMWSLETIGIRGEDAEKNLLTEEMTRMCIRKVGHRYEATMPWKDPQKVFGNNRELAVSRLNNLTKRLFRNPDKLKEYDMAVRQLIKDCIAEPVGSNSKRIIYLPHRPVYKEESTTTKLRIVFDASAHTNEIPSLNEQLFTGTNLLPDVFSILLNFRLRQIGIVADIEKAFLQISLKDSDRDSHRFLWYPSLAEIGKNIQDFRMTRVTFGVNCSPFILAATIKHHLREEQRYPETCRILEEGFYVDDLVVSMESESEAVKFCHEAVEVMGKASMNLRKWHSNNARVRAVVGVNNFSNTHKVLGLHWSPFSDELSVPLDSIQQFLQSSMFKGTKRNLLQAIARVYDPLGIVSPTMIKLKILFQTTWRRKLAWDEALPADLMLLWNECVNNVLQLKDMSIPRAVQLSPTNKVYFHIFADASNKAYGAVAYIQTVSGQEEVAISFLCAKSRVAPLKNDREDELTLPKLELTAALIASILCVYLRKHLRVTIDQFFLWTDSKITLHWIYGETQRWKPYVQSRVLEIRRNTNLSDWRHCSGKSNPADLITRGISGTKLVSSLLWEQGPDWLHDVHNFKSNQHCIQINEARATILLETDDVAKNEVLPILCCEKFNSWQRLLRVTCWVLRFISHCKAKQNSPTGSLTPSEYGLAEVYWLRYVQQLSFANDLSYLQKGRQPKPSSKLAQLSPVIDEEGLLRVGGRLQMLDEEIDVVHPIILPPTHHLTAIIVDEYHLLTCHGGTNLVLTKLRSRFWIIRGRQFIKRRIRSCLVCKKLFGPPATQPFAPLPVQRITLTRPFNDVGTDFAGPLYYVKSGDATMHKAYILIFTCAATRAVHLELTDGMSTECCLMGLRRFIARRGVPSIILSDNAKAFRRAALELNNKTKGIFNDDLIPNFLSKRQIKWTFIVERAPWWGGFWERLIRTVKNTLKVVIGKGKLTFEQLRTVLSEAEAVTNDRPLTYISDDPLDSTPLTPAKFLLGWNTSNPAFETPSFSGHVARDLWKNRMKYTSRIAKRWQAEYLQLLRSFHHSNNRATATLQKGDVVLLFDPATPRVHWKMAIIEQTFLGRDGKTRSCELRCADGSKLRRPVQLLYPLELSSSPRAQDVENLEEDE